MTPEEEISRADRAKRIVEDELYQESFEVVRKHILKKWQETGPGQAEEREDLYRQLMLLEKLKGTLTYYMQNGTLAIFRLEQDKRRKNAKQH